MDRSAQNIDRSSESEIRNLRTMKFVFDVSPLEIIDNDKKLFKDEDFFAAAAVGKPINMNQIDLVIHAVYHEVISQYWSLKSDQQQQQLNSACHDQHHHHRDHHHLRDDDDDEEMMLIACQPSVSSPETTDPIILLDRDVFASVAGDDAYIMSQLGDVDLLYEIEWILNQQQLEEVKRCIVRRISESKPALLLLAKTKAARIRLDMSSILKNYYANPAAAASAYEEEELGHPIDYPAAAPPPTSFYDDDDDVFFKRSQTPLNTALRSSKEALETKILEEEDLISSSSSWCSVCLNEFRVGVDVIKKMPCSHMFHSTCLDNWLWERNTCPICYYKLPTFSTRFLEQY